MAKVILINQRPPTPGEGTMLDSIFKRPPNLGLAYIKATLKANGHKTIIANISSIKEARRLFSRHKDADCVGISSITYTAGNAYNTASYFKSIGVPVIIGGVHASLMPMEAATHADCVVVGEGEVHFPRLLESLERVGDLGPKKIVGAIKDSSGKLIPDPNQRVCKLDSLPPPELEDVRQRLHPLLDGVLWHGIPFGVQIATSRGCPHKCSFCQVPYLQGRRVRYHSAEYIGSLLEKYNKKGARSIMFADDNFSFDTGRVSDICKQILERKLDISWFCLCRANWIRSNQAILRQMRAAGCAVVYYGVESASQYVLDGYGKDITPRDSIEAARLLRKEGIGMITSAIIGAERDTIETMEATLAMLREIGSDMVQVAILTQMGEQVDTRYEKYTTEYAVNEHPNIPPGVIETMLREFFIEFYDSRENQKRMTENIGWVLEKSLPWMPEFIRRASFKHVSRKIANNFKKEKFKQPHA